MWTFAVIRSILVLQSFKIVLRNWIVYTIRMFFIIQITWLQNNQLFSLKLNDPTLELVEGISSWSIYSFFVPLILIGFICINRHSACTLTALECMWYGTPSTYEQHKHQVSSSTLWWFFQSKLKLSIKNSVKKI